MTRDNPHLNAAVRYAEHGWPVFPLGNGSKVPLPGSSGFLEATTDDRQIARWYERHPYRNVGIATGAPGPDVVDVDTKGERGNGFAAWNTVKRAGLTGQPSAIVTTPSGGMHAYYAGTDQRNGALKSHGLDFRAAGGYVVAVPSMVDGKRYELVKRDPSASTCDWSAIRDHLEPQPQRAPYVPREGQQGASHLPLWLADVPEGQRNGSLFWAACRAVEAGDHATLTALAETGRQIGLTDTEVRATVRSAVRTASPKEPDRPAAARALGHAAIMGGRADTEPTEREAGQ